MLARIEAGVAQVAPCESDLASATGRVLAGDVSVALHPRQSLALRDGYAVQSEFTADASSYAPVTLASAIRVDAGVPLPVGADAVAPLDTVTFHDGGAEITAPVAVGDGTGNRNAIDSWVPRALWSIMQFSAAESRVRRRPSSPPSA